MEFYVRKEVNGQDTNIKKVGWECISPSIAKKSPVSLIFYKLQKQMRYAFGNPYQKLCQSNYCIVPQEFIVAHNIFTMLPSSIRRRCVYNKKIIPTAVAAAAESFLKHHLYSEAKKAADAQILLHKLFLATSTDVLDLQHEIARVSDDLRRLYGAMILQRKI